MTEFPLSRKKQLINLKALFRRACKKVLTTILARGERIFKDSVNATLGRRMVCGTHLRVYLLRKIHGLHVFQQGTEHGCYCRKNVGDKQ